MVCTLNELASVFLLGLLFGVVLEFWVDVVWRITKTDNNKA